ncbi:MAG: phosphoribosylglycinamide formyltransferase [Ilumatobacteraceae bacterium]|nr:phosphoribosylglycinamide formyltransferase [Ilumatobacteraceae bacterium]
MNAHRPRLVVMVSGNGSNLQAILDACEYGWLGADVVGVVCNKAGVPAIARAERNNVPVVILEPLAGEPRHTYDIRLRAVVQNFKPDVVVLAGFMRILSNQFLEHFPSRVVNLHPALPGELPGTHAIERAFAESRDHWRTHSGITVHLVLDEGVDTGPVLASEVVPIHIDDTLEIFSERMHEREHVLLVQTLSDLCRKISSLQESESVL